MKILRITAQGLPLFKKDLDICFYTQQRVCEEDKDSLYRLTDNYYLHSACAFIGINASGKTSVLKVISLALNIVKNEPINHVEAKSILGGAKNATIRTYFYDKRSYVCCLETVIAAKKSKTGEYVYSILSESLLEKPIATVKSKKYLTDFTGMKPVEQRNSDKAYLSDDVSFIIAHNKKANETVEIFSLLSYTNVNVLPFTEDIPLEVIAFLDPTVEKLCFEQTEGKTFIHLKFKDEEEIILNNAADLEQYLSSGTIKGIIIFSMVNEVLRLGGYLLVDEIERELHPMLVNFIVAKFQSKNSNPNGAQIIFTTHNTELMNLELLRKDQIYFADKNRNDGSSELYSVTDFMTKTADNIRKGYLAGKYGAIPDLEIEEVE